jgi:CRP-like cAMP-binding protein
MAATVLSPVTSGFGGTSRDHASADGLPNAAAGMGATAFAPLVFHEWESLDGIAERHFFSARHELCTQGGAPHFVNWIESGLVKLVRLTGDGGEFILGLRSDGWIIDAASAILNRPLACSAVTLTPCTVRRASRAAFMRLLNTSPSVMRDLNQLICREVHADQEQQIEFRSCSAQSRLDRLLRELSRITRKEDPLDGLPLKRFEVAQLLSITPEHLSRLLRLRDAGHDTNSPKSVVLV